MMIEILVWIAFRDWVPRRIRLKAISSALDLFNRRLESATPEEKTAYRALIQSDPELRQQLQSFIDRYRSENSFD
jgi:hypothetical protein